MMPIRIGRWANGVILAVLLGLLASVPARAMDQQKHDDIKALLEATDALGRFSQVIDLILPQMFDLIKKSNPSVSQEVLDEFRRSAADEIEKSKPELIEPLIAVYDANFSGDDIKQLLAFYQSPIGRKLVAQSSEIFKQSAAIGQVWGRTIGERIGKRLREEAKTKGYKL